MIRRRSQRFFTRTHLLAALLSGVVLVLAVQEVRQLYFRLDRLEVLMDTAFQNFAILAGHGRGGE